MSDYFDNDLPKIVHYYNVDGEIMMVINRMGVLTPVFEDHRLTVDLKKTCCVFYEWLADTYPGCPREWRSGSSYCAGEDDAMLEATIEQDRLAREGKYVPIYVRE